MLQLLNWNRKIHQTKCVDDVCQCPEGWILQDIATNPEQNKCVPNPALITFTCDHLKANMEIDKTIFGSLTGEPLFKNFLNYHSEHFSNISRWLQNRNEKSIRKLRLIQWHITSNILKITFLCNLFDVSLTRSMLGNIGKLALQTIESSAFT